MAKLDLQQLFSAVEKNQDKIDHKQQETKDKIKAINKKQAKNNLQLSQTQKELIQRQSNYEVSKRNVSKWQKTVETNKQAVQLDFRKQQDLASKQFSNKLKQISNQDIGAKMQQRPSSEHFMQQEKQLMEKADNKEKILQELQKQKHLMLYQEIKAKRIKKIKSKLYRKQKKKQKEKEEAKTFESRVQIDPQFALDELEKAERNRALERAKMKYRNSGKFAKMIARYSDKDSSNKVYQQFGMQRQEIEDKLKKIKQQLEDEQESIYDEDFIEDAHKDIDNLQENQTVIKTQPKNIVEEILEKNNMRLQIEELKVKKDLQKEIHIEQEGFKNIGVLSYGSHQQQNNLKSEDKQGAKIEKSNKNKKLSNLEQIHIKQEDLEMLNENEVNSINENGSVSEEEFQNKFEQEKQQIVEQSVPEIDNMLCKRGWGDWTGQGVPLSEKQKYILQKEEEKRRQQIEEAKRLRKDANLKKVILNESIAKNSRNLLVKNIPHGYDNSYQFNFEQKNLLGRDWNTEQLFEQGNKARIVTQAGQEIQPLSLTNQPKRKFF